MKGFYVPGDPGNPGLLVSALGMAGALYFLSRSSSLNSQAASAYTQASSTTLQGNTSASTIAEQSANALAAQAKQAKTFSNVGMVFLVGGLAYYAYKKYG